jgi:hypothetical protein
MSLVSFKTKSNEIFKKIFFQPSKEDYIFVELSEIEKNLDWISRKEDQKNLQKDFENLTNDMRVTLFEYRSKNG